MHRYNKFKHVFVSAVPAAAATMVESAPAVPSRAPAGKLGRPEGGMKAPSARPAKKARQDAFDPMDPVSVNACPCPLKHYHTCRICLPCMYKARKSATRCAPVPWLSQCHCQLYLSVSMLAAILALTQHRSGCWLRKNAQSFYIVMSKVGVIALGSTARA